MFIILLNLQEKTVYPALPELRGPQGNLTPHLAIVLWGPGGGEWRVGGPGHQWTLQTGLPRAQPPAVRAAEVRLG